MDLSKHPIKKGNLRWYKFTEGATMSDIHIWLVTGVTAVVSQCTHINLLGDESFSLVTISMNSIFACNQVFRFVSRYVDWPKAENQSLLNGGMQKNDISDEWQIRHHKMHNWHLS